VQVIEEANAVIHQPVIDAGEGQRFDLRSGRFLRQCAQSQSGLSKKTELPAAQSMFLRIAHGISPEVPCAI
jgi:hypothetical protein